MRTIRFVAKDEHQKLFAKTLRANVMAYFKNHDISTKGDYTMVIKAIVQLSLYLIPFVVILTVPMSPWLALVLTVVMGIGEAGIGMSVMHDAVHGVFSDKQWVNKLMGRTMFVLGSNVLNWRIQHNVLHHTYTNIYGMDGDIDTKAIIRLSKHAPLLKIQKYQAGYAFLLYGLMTLSKLFTDVSQLFMYRKDGTLKALNEDFGRQLALLITTKILYIGVFIVLPLTLTDYTWWQVLIGFLIVHTTASAIMSTVFQMAHVVTDVDQPLPDDNDVIHNEMTVHQLSTTSDFGKNPAWLSWYIGGLDYQVEHHLFPNVSHVHYKKISKMVKDTTQKYGLPYYVQGNFLMAVYGHFKMLKMLGR